MQLQRNLTEVMDYYTEAIAHVERQSMPSVGPSVDRRGFNLLTAACNDRTLCSRLDSLPRGLLGALALLHLDQRSQAGDGVWLGLQAPCAPRS